ncbi:hypothetical protein [uncultured Parabacteroides sp.]|jgi:hypothetical protein|uniref:hypothetical protein n=1 Tax=uncultured Parabacteroides sp. TaxID=512312 RepID=UPI0025EF3135|nr:hypothetical protein [uncultured Parabacteroides sp.]
MKKVEFMKLNLQQENFLSKEEKKVILGGSKTCYVQCAQSPPRQTSSCSQSDIEWACHGPGFDCQCYS